jgi:hypothetical protein
MTSALAGLTGMETREMNETVEMLKKLGTGDAWKTFHFGLVRESETHGTQMVSVEVHERIGGPGTRFDVVATDSDGRQASGNGADSINTALAVVHWDALDK